MIDPVTKGVIKYAAKKSVAKFLGKLTSGADLDKITIKYVLEELPRLKAALEARVEAIEASGCTMSEFKILFIQMIDAQRRTLDPEKRERLASVLVNGFSTEDWSKAKHSLMLRLAFDLEPEHIALLRTPMPDGAALGLSADVQAALENELSARGLLRLEMVGRDVAQRTGPPRDVDAFSGIVRVPVRTKLAAEFLTFVESGSASIPER